MIDDVEIRERPEPEPVSREEANGMWTQLDALRIAVQSHTSDLADIKALCTGVVAELRWGRALLFLLLLERVGSHVLDTAPAQALMAAVSP